MQTDEKNTPEGRMTLDEMRSALWLDTEEYKRQKDATNQQRRMLLQGPERYPGMHADLRFCIRFSERGEGSAPNFNDACRRLKECGAWQDRYLVLPKKGEAPEVRDNVVSLVGRILGGWGKTK